MLITRRSGLSGKINSLEIDVTQEQMDEYEKGGKLIQSVFPSLTSDEREFIMTGITRQEWDESFGS
jgi:hypothetical protein